MISIRVALLLNLISQCAFAAEESAAGAHELAAIPWGKLIVPQLVNFAGLVILLVYFLRKPLREYFNNKSQAFHDQKHQAEAAKVKAEELNQNVRHQLKILEETSDKSVQEAQSVAKDIHEKTRRDAQSSAEKLSIEAQQMAEFELGRAQVMLKLELVTKAAAFAEGSLRKTADVRVQNILNKEFVDKIQAAKI